MHRKGRNLLGAMSVLVLLGVSSESIWADPPAGYQESQGETSETVSDTKDKEYGIADVNTNLNIRSGGGMEYSVIGKLPRDAVCIIEGEENGWACIVSGDVRGYVSSRYLLTGETAREYAEEGQEENLTYAHWIGSGAETAGAGMDHTDSETTEPAKETPDPEEEADVPEDTSSQLEEEVSIPEEEASISQEEITDPAEEEPAAETAGVAEASESIRSQMVEFAEQFLGNPYVWGGTSLTDGADCSGFVQSIYANFGYSLPRVSRDQAQTGTRISIEEAQPGDLIFYARDGEIYHVVMYIGDGQVIHASSRETGIKISNIYYDNAVWAVRILDE